MNYVVYHLLRYFIAYGPAPEQASRIPEHQNPLFENIWQPWATHLAATPFVPFQFAQTALVQYYQFHQHGIADFPYSVFIEVLHELVCAAAWQCAFDATGEVQINQEGLNVFNILFTMLGVPLYMIQTILNAFVCPSLVRSSIQQQCVEWTTYHIVLMWESLSTERENHPMPSPTSSPRSSQDITNER